MPDAVSKLRTRKPTGVPPWPMILLEGEEKSGKAQPLHSRIATPTGWTTMGALAVGDQVVGADGQPTVVTGVFDRGVRPVYRLTFSDGAAVEACDEHLWAVRTSGDVHRRYANGPKVGQPRNLPWRVWDTNTVRERVMNGETLHIPVTAAVEYAPDGPLPLDPYALGLLLGDGCLSKPNYPHFSSGDPELIEALAGALPAGDTLTPFTHDRISVGIKGGRTTAALRDLGLMSTKSAGKFIPSAYLTASVGDRLALLQGLMDTDGGMERVRITYSTVSPHLAAQVQELVRSLGGTCSARPKQSHYRGADGERRAGQPAHVLGLRLPIGVCPFRLGRKIAHWTETRPTFHTPPRRTMRAVDYVGEQPVRCIAVEAPDHLYLTDGFVVTHNTWAALEFSGDPRVGRCWALDLHEGSLDEYGAIPGADFELIDHDGTWADIIGQLGEARTDARAALAAGELPPLLVIDTAGAEWDMLKSWVDVRSRRQPGNAAKLRDDPDAEIKPSRDKWNDADARHRRFMALLHTFPGIVILTARGKEIGATGDDGQPLMVGGKPVKDYRVQAQKDLGFDANAWVRMYRDRPTAVIGLRGTRHDLRPGRHDPKLYADFTLGGLIFDVIGCVPGQTRQRDMRPLDADQVMPDEVPAPDPVAAAKAALEASVEQKATAMVRWALAPDTAETAQARADRLAAHQASGEEVSRYLSEEERERLGLPPDDDALTLSALGALVASYVARHGRSVLAPLDDGAGAIADAPATEVDPRDEEGDQPSHDDTDTGDAADGAVA